MKLRTLALILCLCICVTTLAGCSRKYNFEYDFFPAEVECVDEEPTQDFTVTEIDEKYINIVKTYLDSLTAFVNKKFQLNISKPVPEIKGYIPSRHTAASYRERIVYLYVEEDSDYETFSIIHELVHYLSDNDGQTGFIHQNFSNGKPATWGYGLTEGFTDLVTILYMQENSLTLPQYIQEKTGYYSDLQDLAQVYYTLEPKTIEWLFQSDYQSMTNFVYSSLNSVALIPNEYKDTEMFDMCLYSYTDLLLNLTTSDSEYIYSFQLMYTSSFEMAAVTVRACPDKQIQKNIYDEILINHDQDSTIKNMIFS